MKITEGQLAPNFKGIDIHGKEVNLYDYKGKKIILGFFRNVNCPFCNRRVHELMGMNYKLKQSGIELIFLFESSNEKLKQSVFHEGISPWSILGDPDKKIYQIYGVETSGYKMIKTMFKSSLSKAKKDTKQLDLPEDKEATNSLIPADFFINEKFVVEKAHYGEHIDDHVSVTEIKSFANIT